jgi:DNA replication protein DnaC
MSSEALDLRLKAFRLPGFLENYADMAQRAEKGGWWHVQYLEALSEIEAEERQGRRVARLLRESQLPKATGKNSCRQSASHLDEACVGLYRAVCIPLRA